MGKPQGLASGAIAGFAGKRGPAHLSPDPEGRAVARAG